MRRKFLFVSHQADRTGAPTSLLNIVEELRLQDAGELFVISMRNGENIASFERVADKLYVVSKTIDPGILGRVYGFFKLLILFVKIGPVDCVLVNSSANLRAMLASVILRRRVFVYVRESENMHNSRLGFLRKRLLGFMDSAVCVSASTAVWVKKYVEESKVFVVRNGIDFRKQHCFEQKLIPVLRDKVVGIIGRIENRKGVDRLYEVACSLLASQNNVSILVIGDILDDKYKMLFSELSEKYGVDSIFITGVVENVMPYIKCMDVNLMLSREEALPRSVMEASSLSVPTVALDVAGTVEILPDSYPYILRNYNVNDVCEMVVELFNSELNNSVGTECYKYVKENLNRSANVEKLMVKMIGRCSL